MQTRFTLRQIEYFVAVGEAGSIAVASDRISVSSPSISAAISQLEIEFGLQLFVRQHAKGVTLTPGGQRFLREAKILLEQAGHLHEIANNITEVVKGPVSIGCLSTLAPYIIGEFRESFEKKHPMARVKQVIGHQTELIGKLNHAEIDIAITYDLDIPQEIEFEPLAKIPPYVLVGEQHSLAGKKEVSLKELEKLPVVLLDMPLSREYFLSLFHREKLQPNIRERISDMSVLRTVVANGFGYSLANIKPKTSVSPDGKKLEMIDLKGDCRVLTVGAATIKTAFSSASTTALLKHCRETITEGAVPGASN